MFKLKGLVIKTHKDLDRALARISDLWHTQASSEELQALVDAVEAYEAEHFPIPEPTPLAAIMFRMDQEGYTDWNKHLTAGKSFLEEFKEKLEERVKGAVVLFQKLDESGEYVSVSYLLECDTESFVVRVSGIDHHPDRDKLLEEQLTKAEAFFNTQNRIR